MKINYNLIKLTLLFILLELRSSFQLFEFQHYANQIPHPSKAHRGGQDAYFVNQKLMIVADGVGGWNNYGIDPSKYSRYLCQVGSKIFSQNQQHYRQNVIEIIIQSSKKNQYLGSSTMVVASIDDQYLRTCYIGDSGFVIFRLNDNTKQYELIFQFQQQQHSFNFPFQLARKEYHGDDPHLSICEDFLVQQSDLIVMGSDGLFDNIFVTQILQIINNKISQNQGFHEISQNLAKLAIQRGKDNKFQSPFSKRAKQHKLSHQGGKLDDTTVIVSVVKKNALKNQQNNHSKPLKRKNSRHGGNISIHSNKINKKVEKSQILKQNEQI